MALNELTSVDSASVCALAIRHLNKGDLFSSPICAFPRCDSHSNKSVLCLCYARRLYTSVSFFIDLAGAGTLKPLLHKQVN